MAVENPAIADGIVSRLFSLVVSSKGELNHRSDHRANDWLNNSWWVGHPGSDPRADDGSADTALLTIGPAIGTAT